MDHRHASADITFENIAVHCSILGGTDCGILTVSMPNSGPTTTGATPSAICRRLQFDDDEDDNNDVDHQKSSRESPETVLDYLERLYEDQVARWNMDFRTMTPLNDGRWRWTRVTASESLPADDCVAVDDRCSTVTRNVATKKRRRKMNGKRCSDDVATTLCSLHNYTAQRSDL